MLRAQRLTRQARHVVCTESTVTRILYSGQGRPFPPPKGKDALTYVSDFPLFSNYFLSLRRFSNFSIKKYFSFTNISVFFVIDSEFVNFLPIFTKTIYFPLFQKIYYFLP